MAEPPLVLTSREKRGFETIVSQLPAEGAHLTGDAEKWELLRQKLVLSILN